MSFDQIWIVGLATAVALGLLLGATYFLRSFRRRLLPPPPERRDRGEALADLHRLKADMEREAVGAGQAREGGPASPAKPGGDSREQALDDLRALQAKMRKKLEEDRAREAAAGEPGPPPDPELDDPDPDP